MEAQDEIAEKANLATVQLKREIQEVPNTIKQQMKEEGKQDESKGLVKEETKDTQEEVNHEAPNDVTRRACEDRIKQESRAEANKKAYKCIKSEGMKKEVVQKPKVEATQERKHEVKRKVKEEAGTTKVKKEIKKEVKAEVKTEARGGGSGVGCSRGCMGLLGFRDNGKSNGNIEK